jgi:hypothetical protein
MSFIDYAREQYETAATSEEKRSWGHARNQWHIWWAHEFRRLTNEAAASGDWTALDKHLQV